MTCRSPGRDFTIHAETRESLSTDGSVVQSRHSVHTKFQALNPQNVALQHFYHSTFNLGRMLRHSTGFAEKTYLSSTVTRWIRFEEHTYTYDYHVIIWQRNVASVRLQWKVLQFDIVNIMASEGLTISNCPDDIMGDYAKFLCSKDPEQI